LSSKIDNKNKIFVNITFYQEVKYLGQHTKE
jgi:hypothetical protein